MSAVCPKRRAVMASNRSSLEVPSSIVFAAVAFFGLGCILRYFMKGDGVAAGPIHSRAQDPL